MDASTLFYVCTYLVWPGWLALIFLPRRRGTAFVAAILIPLLLGVVYVAVFVSRLGSMPAGGGFDSLAEVAALFSDEWLLLVGWIHFLAFDLFVGAWEVRDARRVGVPHLVVVPCLVLTFIAGPAGLAIYLLVRGLWKRRWSPVAEPAMAAS